MELLLITRTVKQKLKVIMLLLLMCVVLIPPSFLQMGLEALCFLIVCPFVHASVPSIRCARPHGLELLAGRPPRTAGL